LSYTANQGQVYVPYSAEEVTALIADADKVTATVDVRKAGTYVFRLSVTDDKGGTNTGEVTVIVEPGPTATATVKIIGRNFSSSQTELDLSIADYCSFEGEHEGFTEADFEKITYNFISVGYPGSSSGDRSKDDMDKYIADGIILGSEYGNDDFQYIIQTFFYDNQADTTGSRSFWVFVSTPSFYDIYGDAPEYNQLPAIPTATLTLNKQVTDLALANATVTGITVVSPPAKTTYNVGDNLDLTGLTVRANYSNNTTQIVAVGDNHIRGFKSSTDGSNTITVTYGGKTATFIVTVNAHTVTFDKNGGDTEAIPNTKSVSPPATKIDSLPTPPERTGYVFRGWNTKADGSGTVFTASSSVTTTVIVYAQWVNKFTITFISNGGNDVDPITGVNYGSTISKPEDPTRGYYQYLNGFNGWYTDNATFNNKWIFETNTVTDDITLYAKWDFQYQLGETGPGGGIIFYLSDVGFTMTDTNETCHYLESSPTDLGDGLAWASLPFVETDITGTVLNIGGGRNNTTIILATDVDAPAAKACNEYNNNGKTDWFLPSYNELEQLYINRIFVDNLTSIYYWSSTQYRYEYGTVLDFSSGTGINTSKNSTNYYAGGVRAIRAF
jgi:uncharacterized repeat protein (TIGR02543 family)